MLLEYRMYIPSIPADQIRPTRFEFTVPAIAYLKAITNSRIATPSISCHIVLKKFATE